MSKLISTNTITVDGLADVGAWYVPDGGHDQASRDQFVGAAGMVLGRKTYEGLASYWPHQTGPWPDVLNPLPKFVASRTLSGPLDWNATLLAGDAADAVAGLKDQHEGDLVISGCGELTRALLAAGIVDEVNFWVHPAVGGPGTRPFDGDTLSLRLLEARAFDSGVTLLRYVPA